MTNPVPAGYTAITPYLVVPGVEKELEFLKTALGADVTYTMPGPDGTIVHADAIVDGAHLMLGRAGPHAPATAAMVYVYTADSDAVFAKAAAFPGAAVVMPIADTFYGDRAGTVKTPNAITYCIATRKTDMTPGQIQERVKAMTK